jgi:hypothetical protein
MATRQTRRKVIQTAVAGAAVLPVLPAQQHSHQTAANATNAVKSAYAAQFLTPAEYALLGVLADLIIPRTTTPGASDAGVPEFIDRVAFRDPMIGAQIKAGLDWLTSAARSAHARPFEELGAGEQIGILTPISLETSTEPGHFFRVVKDLTIDGYYSSREGLMIELGWNANTYVQKFEGCTHPEHQRE